MKHRVSVERAVSFTKSSVRLSCTWPPPMDSKKCQSLVDDLAWSLAFLSVLGLLFPLINSIYEYRNDSIILLQSIGFAFACAMILIKTLVLRIHRRKFQILVHEMENFIKNPEPHEKRILQSYVDGCWLFHGLITLMNYLACIPVIFGPFMFPDRQMPTFAVYPFPTDSGLVMYLVFIHQSIVGFQTSAALTIDCQVALMMWFAGARLEILADEIKSSSNVDEFRYYVDKHDKLLSYANRVADTMCYIALTNVGIGGFSTITGTVQLVGDRPLIIKMQYGPATLVSLINLLVCAWPTENIIRVCDLIGKTIYDISWMEMSPKFTRDAIIMIMRRSQRPVRVAVGGFLPDLSLRFYASFVSSIFSYFTTVRLLLMSDDEN